MLKKAVLLAITATYATSGYADQTGNSSELEKVVVTATKTEREISKTPVSTEVITQAQIEAIGAKSLKDIFTNIPGVFVNPNASSLSIRGVGGKGTLLLIDGRRIGSEYSNVYDSNRISANSIERIEIVKGPAGSLCGSDALGGVINIITKKTEDGFEASIGGQSGMNSDGQGAVTQVDGDLRGRSGDTGYSAWFSAQNSESYTEKETAQLKAPKGGGQPGLGKPSESNIPPIKANVPDTADVNTTYQSPAEVVNVGGQLTHDLTEELTLKINASYMKETRESDRIGTAHPSNYNKPDNSGTTFPTFNVPIHQELENERTDLGIGADYDVSKTLAINWQSSQSHYKKEDDITTPLWKELGYSSESDSASLSGTGEATATNHELTATWTANEQNRILIGGEYFEDKRQAAFFSGDGSEETKTLQTSSAFVQHEWQVTDPLSLVYGLRYDNNHQNDDATTFNAGGVYQFNSAANLRLRYAQGFRSPDSQELFVNRYMPNGKRLLGADVVDASVGKQEFDLKSERSDNYEIGLQGRGQDWSYDVAVYQNQITDSILMDTSNAAYNTFYNASKVDITGLEFTGSKQLIDSIRLELYANLMETENQETKERLEYTPDQYYSVTVDYQVTSSFNAMLIAQYVGDQYYLKTSPGLPAEDATADAYTPVNLKLNYSPEALKNINFFGGIDNILDTEVDKVLGSSVGTYFYGGVRVYF